MAQHSDKKESSNFHLHVFRRHVPDIISYLFLATLIVLFATTMTLYTRQNGTRDIFIEYGERGSSTFVYGSWPALENADFFRQTKQSFVDQGASFVEADLSAMVIRYYEGGTIKKEAPIATKGREGSWWETPAGLYQISTKEESHFSSFGRVNMPYSMQFQGNFFIHGPTSYPDGTPTPSSYSGGCIRVGLEDMKEIYELTEVGTPLLVFEDSFRRMEKEFVYKDHLPISHDVAYLTADLESNFVFAENKIAERMPIASITKLVTALIAVEYINVERPVYITEDMIATTSVPRLTAGERVAVLDLLSLLLRESSNEAALAIPTPVGAGRFLSLMNEKAAAIGMQHSSFVDTSGVRAENVSTAEDLFHLAKYLYNNRSFILHMSMGNENRIAYGPPRYAALSDFNDIPGIEGEVGGKTGISTAAGDSMLSVIDVEVDGAEHTIAFIVLGSDDAMRDISVLLQHIESNYATSDVVI